MHHDALRLCRFSRAMHEKSCLAREAVASMEGLYGYTEVALELMIRLVQVHTWSSLENPVNDIKHPISSLSRCYYLCFARLYYNFLPIHVSTGGTLSEAELAVFAS